MYATVLQFTDNQGALHQVAVAVSRSGELHTFHRGAGGRGRAGAWRQGLGDAIATPDTTGNDLIGMPVSVKVTKNDEVALQAGQPTVLFQKLARAAAGETEPTKMRARLVLDRILSDARSDPRKLAMYLDGSSIEPTGRDSHAEARQEAIASSGHARVAPAETPPTRDDDLQAVLGAALRLAQEANAKADRALEQIADQAGTRDATPPVSSETPKSALGRLEQVAGEIAAMRLVRDDLIADALLVGFSQRQVAAASGLSVNTVRSIMQAKGISFAGTRNVVQPG